MFLPKPPVQSHGTDGPPALVQDAAGLLQGVTMHLSATSCVFIPKQDVTQIEHRRDALCVLLDVPLQLLDRHGDRDRLHVSVEDTGAQRRRPPYPISKDRREFLLLKRDRKSVENVSGRRADLLLDQPPLDLLVVTDAVGDRSRQLGLYVRQPRAQVTHVLVQLLHCHQSLF